MKNLLKIFTLIIAHLLAIGVIIYSFFPIAKWYFDFRPIWGIDFYNTVTLTQFLRENLNWPASGWIYSWFAGFPMLSGYPLLHNYFILPLTYFFDPIFSVQLWAMVSIGLFIVGAYFLFFLLSKNFILSAILAVAAAYSGGVYQALTWAGSIPAFATQAFFPWVLVFTALYLAKNSSRFLLTAAALAGLSIAGHPQIFVVYIVPAVMILIFLNFAKGFNIVGKLKTGIIFLSISVLIGLPFIYSSLGNALKLAVKPGYQQSALSTTGPPTQTDIDIATFNKLQVKRMITDNNGGLFIILPITTLLFVATLAITRKLKSIPIILPWLVISGYFSFYIWLFGAGISIFHGGWYRLFWSVPVWVGAATAVFWGEANRILAQFLNSKTLKVTFVVLLTLIILLTGGMLLIGEDKTAIWEILYRSQASSAYPDILNLNVAGKEFSELKSKLVPEWLEGDNTNFRIYDGDQTVNIWWPSFYKMPLSRGYLDPPAERGFLFWLDAALSETDGEPQLVESFGYPADSAKSNALFLIDWNAIKFYEGGHTGAAFTPFPKYLTELVKKEEILDFNQRKHTMRPVTLRFNQIKDEYTSPILAATNAPVLGIFAGEQGFETVVRTIAEQGNLNSQILIPVKLGKFIDDYNLETLKKFDALYLYDYDYKNFDKAFKKLNEYTAAGKKVFVETGVEVKQSTDSLPEFFPVKKVERKGLGTNWQFEVLDENLTKDIDFSKFSPPIFDETEWKISYATDSDLREGAKVILKNQGRIVAASQKVGQGEVIWSGLNLAYHQVRFHNGEEAKFSQNILNQLVDLSRKPAASYQTKFINPRERIIETEGAKGVLFKENAYDGWKAQILESSNGNGKAGKVEIFKVGPSTPGFIYVSLPDAGKVKVKFKYSGATVPKIVTLVSAFTGILVLEELLLKGIVLGRIRARLWLKLKNKVGSWWEREDE